MVGTVIGNYRLLEEIATGGMGTVYRAKHELIGRPAAVKLLRPDLDAHQELIDRFFNEARAATAIRHPGIVEVFDFGYTPEGHGYLVMELLVGKTLKRALADVERFTEGEAAAIARSIASALKAAHNQGIYHRDLKPDNVFMVPDLEGMTGQMRPKVLDFGIAKLAESGVGHTQMGMLIGTPLYMAPEQAREASAVDHRADLYSLGCMLYELLTGRPPFYSEASGEILAMHLMDAPVSPRVLQPYLSPAMEAIVLRLLAKDPADRFQTAGELIHALAPLIDGGRAISRPSPLPPPHGYPRAESSTKREYPPPVATAVTPRPARQRSYVAIIAGAVVAAIVIAAIAYAVLRVGPKPPPAGPPPALPDNKIKIQATPSAQVVPADEPARGKPSAATSPSGSPLENDLGEDTKR